MNRNLEQDMKLLAEVFYSRLNEDSTWDNPFGYHKWKPHVILEILHEEPAGEFSDLHQDYLSDEQRQYVYMLYKNLPNFIGSKQNVCLTLN